MYAAATSGSGTDSRAEQAAPLRASSKIVRTGFMSVGSSSHVCL
jgi:hypothetical protein